MKTKSKVDDETLQVLQDSDSTKELLENASLAMLNANGVLAGLNLREVAERAGVNRGLVYHHFGSRDQLLRSALKRDLRDRLNQVTEGLSLPFNARVRQMMRTMIRHEPALRLALLLLLDGKERVKLAPLKDQWLRSFAQDVEGRELPADLDQEAFLVLVSALSYGYAVMRKSFAEEFDADPVSMDWRVDAVLERLLKQGVMPPEEQV